MTDRKLEMMGYEATLEGGVRRITRETLQNGAQGRDIEGLVSSAASFADGTVQDLATKQPPPQPIACADGCHFCCITTEVHAAPLEVLHMARHVEATYDFTRQAMLLSRLREWAQGRLDATAESVRRPCPLLEDGRCGAYAARPMVCRGFNSYDAGVCERHKIDGDDTPIEGYVHQDRVHQATLLGLANGADEARRAGAAVDLAPALLARLTDPAAETRWLAGVDEFKEARIRERK